MISIDYGLRDIKEAHPVVKEAFAYRSVSPHD